jgi:hypothetical protein
MIRNISNVKKEGRSQRYEVDQRNKQDEKKIPPGHGFLSLVSVVCYQVEVSGTGRSFVQRNLETLTMRRPRLSRLLRVNTIALVNV